MKKTILLLICFCLFSPYALETQAHDLKPSFVQDNSIDLPPGFDELVLQGNLLLNVGPYAIEAGYDGNSIYIQFNQNLGYVDVTIYNPGGLSVYCNVINTAIQQQLVIPFYDIDEGYYTIVVENAFGYANGEFEKDSNR